MSKTETKPDCESNPKNSSSQDDRGTLSTSAKCRQVCASVGISLNSIAAGALFGYTGIILKDLTSPNSDFYLTTEQSSIYTSILTVGCLLGSIICGPLAVRYGQRKTILILLPLNIIGWIISYFSSEFLLHLLSRIILGVFLSSSLACASTYITETVHCSIRGKLVAMSEFSKQLGFLLVFVVGSTDLNWRLVGLVCGLTPLVIPCLVLFFIPDSPRWMAVTGQPEERIKKSLTFFRGKRYNVEEELRDIQMDVASSKDSGSDSFWSQLKLLKQKSLAKRFALLVYLNFAADFNGDPAINSYAVLIFDSAKTGISAYKSTVIIGVLRVVGAILYFTFVADRIGRRKNVIIFSILCSLCTGVLGVYFFLLHNNYDTSQIFWLPLASLVSFTFCNCLYFPVFDLLRSELLPNSIRTLGVNILLFVFHFSIFIVSLTYPLMVETIGTHVAFWIYSANSILMAAVIFICLPETKGKSLEDIAKMF